MKSFRARVFGSGVLSSVRASASRAINARAHFDIALRPFESPEEAVCEDDDMGGDGARAAAVPLQKFPIIAD